jgi:hypothetical protein
LTVDAAVLVHEDVDLVWRLHDAGWRIRYDPAVRVSHHEPRGWAPLLARRFRYGTSAAPLAMRHPGQVPPVVLHPWPALTVAGLLAGRLSVAGLADDVAYGTGVWAGALRARSTAPVRADPAPRPKPPPALTTGD